MTIKLHTAAALVALTLLGCGGAPPVERPAGTVVATAGAATPSAQAVYVGLPGTGPGSRVYIHASSGPGAVHASTGGARMILSHVPLDGMSSANVIAVAEQRAWSGVVEAWPCADRIVFWLVDGSVALSDAYLGDLRAVTPGDRNARFVAVADGRLLFHDVVAGRGRLVNCRTGELSDLGTTQEPDITWMRWTPLAGVVAMTADGEVYRAASLSGPFERTAIRFAVRWGAPVPDMAIEIPEGSGTPFFGDFAEEVEPEHVDLARVPREVAWFNGEPGIAFPLRNGGWYRRGRVYSTGGRVRDLDVCSGEHPIPFNGGVLYFCGGDQAQVITADGSLRAITLGYEAEPDRWLADPRGPSLACIGCGPGDSTVVFIGDGRQYEVPTSSSSSARPIGVRGGWLLIRGTDWAGYWVAPDGSVRTLGIPGETLAEISLSDDGVVSLLLSDGDWDEAQSLSFWASFDYSPARQLPVPPETEFVAFARADLGVAIAGSRADDRRAWVSRDRGETWVELALDGASTVTRDNEYESESALRCNPFGCRWHDVWLGALPAGESAPVIRAAAPLAPPDVPAQVVWECGSGWVREPMYPLAHDPWMERSSGSYVSHWIAVEVRGGRVRLHVADADERGTFEWASAWGFERPTGETERFAPLAVSRHAALIRWCSGEPCQYWIIRHGRPGTRIPTLEEARGSGGFRFHRGALHWVQSTEQRNVIHHVSWTPTAGIVVGGEVDPSHGWAQFGNHIFTVRRPARGRETWIPTAARDEVRMTNDVTLCSTPAADESLVDSHLGLARVQITPDGLCLRALMDESGVWMEPDGENRLSGTVERFSGELSAVCERSTVDEAGW